MNRTKVLTATIAVAVIVGGAVAVGAASPAEQAAANSNGDAGADDASADDPAMNASDADTEAMNESEDAAANGTNARADADRKGPGAVDLPAQVPDHVHEIHSTIDSFLNGSIDHLGNSLSELLSGEEAGNADGSDNADASENAPEQPGSASAGAQSN